jgi:hypothetical protein
MARVQEEIRGAPDHSQVMQEGLYLIKKIISSMFMYIILYPRASTRAA